MSMNLYRRNGRRRSNPASPTSPGFTRRFDRGPRQIDSLTPDDEAIIDHPGQSPLLHSDPVPSRQHAPSFHDHTYSSRPSDADVLPITRESEEQSRPSAHTNGPDSARTPSSDGSEVRKNTPLQNRQPPPFEVLSRSSPIMPSSARRSEDKGGYSPEFFNTSPDIRLPNLRHYSTSTYSNERSYFDDNSTVKGSTGKKSRLNLLNPMSLLARRRSSQTQRPEDAHLSVNTLPVPALPDNFQPSIRGNIVHDFSMPRTKRMYSHSDAIRQQSSPLVDARRPSTDTIPLSDGIASSPLVDRFKQPTTPHNPAFKEHFQDDDRVLQPGRTSYLQGLSIQPTDHNRSSSPEIPIFAKSLPSKVPEDFSKSTTETSQRTEPQTRNGDSDHKLVSPQRTPPPLPPKGRDDTPLPRMRKHMTSTSSRFSFYPGSSMQEKLLEEKHKQQAAAKKTDSGNFEDDFDQDYDFDQDDGLEEKIPGVNADFDDQEDMYGNDEGEEEEEIPTFDIDKPAYLPKIRTSDASSVQAISFQGFHFTPQSATFSPTTTYPPSQPTPRDQEGKPIGIANFGDISQSGDQDGLPLPDSDELPQVVSFLEGLGISSATNEARSVGSRLNQQIDDYEQDDLYFDDGEFGDEVALEDDDDTGDKFNEAIFDDGATSHLRDIPAENAAKLKAAQESAKVPNTTCVSNGPPSESVESSDQVVAGLTEGNLASLHDALASAANKAAANGRFDRNYTFDKNSEDTTSVSRFESSQPGQLSDSSFYHGMESSAITDEDGFPYDDDYDDPMIAEANAEALENDEDGFYGQEFGFYARAHGKGGSQFVNGGFFAARGSNGVKRSHSAKNNFQEPSLTPITERSEWSTRNSVASFAPGGFPASAQSLPSPGIQQLLEMDSPAYDDDMSLSALMKLRGRAFGGSSSSLNSMGHSHPVSSPLAHLSGSNYMFADHQPTPSRLASSVHSLPPSAGIPETEEEEEDETGGWLPTLTQNTPRKRTSERMPVSPSPYSTSLPIMPLEYKRSMHSRSGSGTESVSYALNGDGKWILERKRTSEDGNEQIDREELQGMRI